MAYREHGTTVAGEVVRAAIVFVVVEAFLVWASTILPKGEVLAQLILLALIVLIVPGATLIFVVSGVRRARASQRYRRLTLAELQRSAPSMPVGAPSLVAVTLYGNELQPWFEALFDKTFQDGPGSVGDRAILTRHYVGLLTGLETYMLSRWPDPQPADENGQITLHGPAGETNPLYHTFRWLGEVAADQAARSDGSEDRPGPAWDATLFQSLEIPKAVRTACTPARLRTEIERLSST